MVLPDAGAGVFENPRLALGFSIGKVLQEEFPNTFKQVVFAIPTGPKGEKEFREAAEAAYFGRTDGVYSFAKGLDTDMTKMTPLKRVDLTPNPASVVAGVPPAGSKQFNAYVYHTIYGDGVTGTTSFAPNGDGADGRPDEDDEGADPAGVTPSGSVVPGLGPNGGTAGDSTQVGIFHLRGVLVAGVYVKTRWGSSSHFIGSSSHFIGFIFVAGVALEETIKNSVASGDSNSIPLL